MFVTYTRHQLLEISRACHVFEGTISDMSLILSLTIHRAQLHESQSFSPAIGTAFPGQDTVSSHAHAQHAILAKGTATNAARSSTLGPTDYLLA